MQFRDSAYNSQMIKISNKCNLPVMSLVARLCETPLPVLNLKVVVFIPSYLAVMVFRLIKSALLSIG
jgi:hypothetical protein